MSYQKRIADLVNKYADEFQALQQHFRTINAATIDSMRSGLYTDEGLVDFRDSRTVDKTKAMYERAASLKADAQKVVEDARKDLEARTLSMSRAGVADYHVKMSLALQFIQAAGRSVTDDGASAILHDFIYDVKAMKQFRNIIAAQTGHIMFDISGNPTFPETFGFLTMYERIEAKIKELESSTEEIFTRPLHQSEVNILNNKLTLFVPEVGYYQVMDARNAQEEAGELDALFEATFDRPILFEALAQMQAPVSSGVQNPTGAEGPEPSTTQDPGQNPAPEAPPAVKPKFTDTKGGGTASTFATDNVPLAEQMKQASQKA